MHFNLRIRVQSQKEFAGQESAVSERPKVVDGFPSAGYWLGYDSAAHIGGLRIKVLGATYGQNVRYGSMRGRARTSTPT